LAGIVGKWSVTEGKRSFTLYEPSTLDTVEFCINSTQCAIDTSNIQNSTWIHYIGVYDGASIKLYRNGQLVNSISYTQNLNNSDQPVLIGRLRQDTGETYGWNGLLDDVRIYNYALTTQQVKDLYTGGAVNFSQ